MLYIILCGIMSLILVLFIMMIVTTNNLNDRITQNEKYLKIYSEDLKQIKLLLKNEVAMANNNMYPLVQTHINYEQDNNK